MTYQNPKVTVDGLVIQDNQILLIKRGSDPFKNHWALPGGFVEYGETTEDAVIREIQEETGLSCMIDDLLGVYSDPRRDPRGHTISIVYVLKKNQGDLHSGDDAVDAQYFPLHTLPSLAFDHHYIIEEYKRREQQ